MELKNYAIILASGSSQRLKNLSTVKQFAKIAGKTILEHTISVFEKNENIDEIIVVTQQNYIDYCQELIIKNNFKKISKILIGGNSRQESSKTGIFSINGNDNDNVLIHDAVRPFVTDEIINNCIYALENYCAVDVAIDSADTIIKINEKNIIEQIPKRALLKRGQTPQAFKLGIIKHAHNLAKQEDYLEVTDDCALVKKFNLAEIFVVKGDESNIKITYPLDIDIADKIFQLRSYDIPKTNLNDLKDKVLVVFGASKGIGFDIAQISTQFKAKVYGFSRQNGVDVSKIDDVERALSEVYQKEKRIDYVVNTAGILKMGNLETRNIEEIQSEIMINYFGSIYVLKKSIPYLKETKGSFLLFASSSYTRGRANYSIYSSCKAALVNLVQAVSEEHAKDEIKINIINPQRTATPMRFENFGNEPKETLLNSKNVALATLMTLLADLSGQVINVTLENEKNIAKILEKGE